MSKLTIKIPCNIGDTVYRKWSAGKHGKCLCALIVRHIIIDEYGVKIYAAGNGLMSNYRELKLNDFGSIWWADKEEAEEKLKEKENKNGR